MITETNRQEILELMYEMRIKYNGDLLYDLDMWSVFIIVLTPFNTYETNVALFHNRFDAEEWLKKKTKDKPYYAVCCGETTWDREEELLKKKFRME